MSDTAGTPTAAEAFAVYREIEPRAHKRDFEAGYRTGKRIGVEDGRAEERAARASLVEVMRAWEPSMRASHEGNACLQDEFGLFGCEGCDATSRGFLSNAGYEPHRFPFYHDEDCKVELFMRALAGASTPAEGEQEDG